MSFPLLVINVGEMWTNTDRGDFDSFLSAPFVWSGAGFVELEEVRVELVPHGL